MDLSDIFNSVLAAEHSAKSSGTSPKRRAVTDVPASPERSSAVHERHAPAVVPDDLQRALDAAIASTDYNTRVKGHIARALARQGDTARAWRLLEELGVSPAPAVEPHAPAVVRESEQPSGVEPTVDRLQAVSDAPARHEPLTVRESVEPAPTLPAVASSIESIFDFIDEQFHRETIDDTFNSIQADTVVNGIVGSDSSVDCSIDDSDTDDSSDKCVISGEKLTFPEESDFEDSEDYESDEEENASPSRIEFLNKKKYHYVYEIVNSVNGKLYYGVHSTDDLDDGYLGSGSVIGHAKRKYGKENFAIEILAFYDDRTQAGKAETRLLQEILHVDCGGDWGVFRKFCYNTTVNEKYGDSTVCTIAPEVRKKISEAQTPEVRARSAERMRESAQYTLLLSSESRKYFIVRGNDEMVEAGFNPSHVSSLGSKKIEYTSSTRIHKNWRRTRFDSCMAFDTLNEALDAVPDGFTEAELSDEKIAGNVGVNNFHFKGYSVGVSKTGDTVVVFCGKKCMKNRGFDHRAISKVEHNKRGWKSYRGFVFVKTKDLTPFLNLQPFDKETKQYIQQFISQMAE